MKLDLILLTLLLILTTAKIRFNNKTLKPNDLHFFS
jgi:hypothetical protein